MNTLLIDGNWLLMNKQYQFAGSFLKENDMDIKKKAQIGLMDSMLQSINWICNLFPIENMILVTDGGSWRKMIERPAHLEGKDYKGTRQKDETVDWHMIFESLEMLREKFTFNSITATKAYGIEGDDWISSLSRRLTKTGNNVVIWSTDNDLSQLVSNDTNGVCVWYNNKELKVHKDLEVNELAFLSDIMIEDKLNFVNKLAEIAGNIAYINPQDIIISKIICGDKSDNIIPVAQYTTTKTYSITDKQFEPIKEELELTCSDDVTGKAEEIADAILSIKTVKKQSKYGECKKEDIVESILYNAKMVELKDELLPVDLKAVIDATEILEYDLEIFRNNYKVILGEDSEALAGIEEVSFDSLPF